ncbi:MAG: septal ring lytic transglycosylase RlpA family lipoprotein [Cytophagales bacterium CG18_big_fil_WC_8_21_14_2_50_42_9]|nr:MAG: septal ring lytic transglycosylase RlpA family lipoprotein [Cytophagales bacterium CG18_big_fil_WC_8_21_14_2_50_42_9]
MRINKLHYVFSFIFILFLNLHQPGYAQKKGTIQKGSATWYGSQYHGQKTSSGEVYNKNRLTAAHPSLPFGTQVKVTNAVNNQSVVVRINDRGPFGKKGYIIDLSEAAARKIALRNAGYGKVTVQVLSTAIAQNTEEDQNTLAVLTQPSDAVQIANAQQYHLFKSGPVSDMIDAQLEAKKKRAFDEYLNVNQNVGNVQGKKIHRIETVQFSNRSEAEAFKTERQKVKHVTSAS